MSDETDDGNHLVTTGYHECCEEQQCRGKECCGERSCELSCERPCCLKNTFTAEVENGVWQGGLGFGTKPLRTDCFYPTANGDWFPITPRIKWTAKHCLCNDSCCCADSGVWIERAPWECGCEKRPVCCSELELVQVDDNNLALARYEPVLDCDGQVVYKKVAEDNAQDNARDEQDGASQCCGQQNECFEDDNKPCSQNNTCGKTLQATVARRPSQLLSLVAPPLNESYNFARPVVRQYSAACSVRSIAPAGTRFYGTSSFANEVNSQKWPGGYEPRSGAAICGFLL